MTKKTTEKSFSLFEFLIYLSILSIVLISFTKFYLPIRKSVTYSRAVLQLEKNLNSTLNLITYNIQQAEDINLCSGSNLDLKMADSSINPTVFSLNNGIIYIKQGTESQYPLTGSNIYIDSLVFEKIDNLPPASPSVKITISAHYNGPDTTSHNTTKTLECVASLR